jgi:hypothetical protein
MRNQISTIAKMTGPLHFGVLKSTKLPYLLILNYTRHILIVLAQFLDLLQ